MLVSWNWLSQLVDTQGVDPQAFAQLFTCTVAEIDGVHRWGFGLEGVYVADVVAVAPHPNADKLRLGTVDLGDRQVTVVCGAPNLAVGMRVPFVAPGTTLPTGVTIQAGEVRGIPSPGMLASEADLGLSDDNSGLLSLDGVSAKAGTPLNRAIQLEDVLYEVDNKSITHRPDLWGLYGMAREVAAMLGRPLKILNTDVALSAGPPIDVAVQTPVCPRYVCARIADVQVQPSPVEARLLLRRLGVRPISNVVDATNLVMLETGNPLHAFDARYVRGQRIVVRQAEPGEQILTLDGQTRSLTAADTVIADGEGPVALAGVMGGGDSEIRDDTREVILEAAAFDGAAIRKTAMRVGLRTESSARFEKALDPELPLLAAKRFLKLLVDLSPGAKVVSDLLDAGPHRLSPPPRRVIDTSASYLRSRLGVSAAELSDEWLINCLQSLEFVVERPGSGDLLRVTVPTFRATKDVHGPADLVEELGRHYGYNRIASQAPLIAARPPHTPQSKLAERKIRQALVLQRAMQEQITYGFDNENTRAHLGLREGPPHAELPRLGLRNALSSELVRLRRNLAPNLLAAVEQGLLRGDGQEAPKEGLQVALFELGRVFVPVASGSATDLALDHGVPDLASEPGLKRDAWFKLMDAEMAGAVHKTLASNNPLPFQPIRLGIAVGERLGGGAAGSKHAVASRAVSQRVFAEAVAAVQAAAKALGKGEIRVVQPGDRQAAGVAQMAAAPDDQVTWLHPARYGWLVGPGDQPLGLVTLLHPDVRAALDVAAEVAVAEVDLSALIALPLVKPVGQAPAKHPSSQLDITVKLPAEQRVGAVIGQMSAQLRGQALPVDEVRYLYEFAGADGLRAVTLRLSCRAKDRTLTPEELSRIQSAAVAFAAPAVGS